MKRRGIMARSKKVNSDFGKTLLNSIHQIVADKGFDRDEVLSILEAGMLAAYRKKYKTVENARVEIDEENERVEVIANRQVVDDVVLSGMQISLTEAQEIDPSAKLGDYVDVAEDPGEYGRISAQTAYQVVSQRLKNLETNKVREEYSEKVGELSNGFILRKRNETVYVDLGKVEAIMPVKHQIPGEKYHLEEKIKVLLHSIGEEERGNNVKIIVSRADKKFVQKMFEMEVPEIYDGVVEIKNIARIAGTRSKVVIHSNRSDIDPVGACVGVRGVRIQAIVRELGNERIDIVEFSADDKEFIKNAMSPAVPEMVKVDSDKREALAIVADKDYSIAIGKDGSNVKLASLLTGFRIDVKTHTQFSEEMSSPEARKRLDELFSTEAAKQENTNDSSEDDDFEEGTPLQDLDGLTKRVIDILNENNIKYIEDLVDLDENELAQKKGIGKTMAKKIVDIISESVEFEEDEDDADETDEENNEEQTGEQESE